MIDLKEEVMKLSLDLQIVKRKQFEEMQNLATVMNKQNADALADLKALQDEYDLPPLLPGQATRSESSEPNYPSGKGLSRARSSSFAAKMKGLFAKSGPIKKKSHSRESSKDFGSDGQ